MPVKKPVQATTGERKQPAATTASSSKNRSPELRTLLLKEELFTEHLTVTVDLLQLIRDAGINIELTNEQLDKAGNNREKVKKLLEALAVNWNDEYFDKLCNVFENSVDPWLCDELRIELQGENGTQQISEALDLENGRIVFKEFGHEKRLSELEKKRLHKLLNRKTQCTRDIWVKQLARLNDKLDEATRKGNAIDQEALRLAREIQQFITENAADGFKNRAVVATVQSTTDIFRQTPALKQLETQMQCLIQLTGQSLMETDNINDEKRRVIDRIEPKNKLEQPKPPLINGTAGKFVNNDDEKAKIDVKLSHHLEDRKQSIIDCKKAIEEQQKLSVQLLDDIERAERARQQALAEKQRAIDFLKQQIDAKQLENEDTEACVKKLEAELRVLQQKLDQYTQRATHLENGKRLNDIISVAVDVKVDEGKKDSGTGARKLSPGQLPRIKENEISKSTAKAPGATRNK